MPTATTDDTGRGATGGSRVAAALAAGTAIVPSVFWVGIEESFITPKLVAVSVLLGFCLILLAVTRRGARGRMTIFDWCVFAYLILTLASTWGSVDRGQSFWGEQYQRQGLLAAGIYATTYGIARLSISPRVRLVVLARAISFGGIPVALYALAQRAGIDVLWDEIPGGRVFSTIGQTNSLGAYLALVVAVSAGLAVATGRAGVWHWVAAGLQLAALVLTESRGGYVGSAVGLVVLGVLVARLQRWRWERVAIVLTGVGLALFVVAASAPGLSDASERAWSRALSADEWSSGSIRNHLDLWDVAGHVVADHPLLGTGPDTFPLVFGDYRDDVLPADSATRLRVYRVESPHNIVLAHAAGSGVPAAALFLVIIVGPLVWMSAWLVRRTGWTYAVEAGLVAAIAAGLVASLFITADFATTWLLWVIAGALASQRESERYPTSASTSAGIDRSDADAGAHSTNV